MLVGVKSDTSLINVEAIEVLEIGDDSRSIVYLRCGKYIRLLAEDTIKVKEALEELHATET